MNYEETSSSSDALKCSQCEQKCNSYAYLELFIFIFVIYKKENAVSA